MANNEVKVKTLKWKKERINYTIVICDDTKALEALTKDTIDNILELTKKVIKNGKESNFCKYRLVQGYNEYSKQFRKNNKKIGKLLFGIACLPKIIMLGGMLNGGYVSGKNRNRFVRLAYPAE